MTQVLIDDVLPYSQLVATGGQVIFDTTWTANAASDVVVYSRPAGTLGDDILYILPTSAYSVSFIGLQQIVRVTLITPSTIGDIVTIVRNTPADRQNLYSNTNFVPSMLNNDFGILTLVDQQAQLVNQDIAPRYNYSSVIVNPKDTILPILPANHFWAKNGGDTAIVPVDIGTIIAGGTVTEVNTGLGLTGGPITTAGTISFASIPANTFWGNITAGTALPTTVSTSYFLISSNNLSDVPNKAIARINLGLQIGVDVQAYSPALTSIAGLTTIANNLIYTTAPNTYAVIAPVADAVLITNVSKVPSLSQTLPNAVQTNITLLGIQAQPLDMGTNQIHNVVDPSNAQDAATKFYVDAQSGNFLPITGGTMQGVINMGNHKITGLSNPTVSTDAVTLNYLNTQLATYLPLSGGTMTGNINMNSQFIQGLSDPINPQDAATRSYVDSVAVGFTVKQACYAATTTALTATYNNGASGIGATLTNAAALAQFTTDGTTPPTNARILVKNQASTLQNGIYTLTNQGSIAVAYILTRATDFDQPSEIQPGDLVIINNGTANAGTSWIQTDTVIAVGVDPIEFSQFTFSATSVLLKANNLSDVANTTTSFNNISPLTTKGDLIAYSTQNVRLAVGVTNGQVLQVDSSAVTGVAWSTTTYPSISGASGKFLISDGTNNVYSTSTIPTSAGATAGKVLASDGTNYVLSSAAFPTTVGATGTILRSDGTNWVATTSTYPNTNAISTLLYASSANVMSALTTANNGLLVTSSTGVPSILAGPGTTGQILQANAAAAPSFSTASYPSTTTVSQLLYSSATNTVAGLTTANSAVLLTGSTGVPVWSGTMTNGQIIIGSTGAIPVAASITAGTNITITPGAGSITIDATGTANAFSQIAIQSFVANGTYTPTSGMKYCIAEVTASGGGGGGANATNASAGGGGAGGYAKVLLTAAQIGASKAVTIGAAGTAGSTAGGNGGAGNTSSLGTLISCTGGAGGTGTTLAAIQVVAGGAGGVPTVSTGTAIITMTGQAGGYGINGGATIFGTSGQGGSNPMGQGGQSVGAGGTNVTGKTNTGFGGGAGGGSYGSSGTAGGASTTGQIVITEFI